WGFIDKKGNFVVPAQYSWVTDFSEGLALVCDKDSSGRIFCIDKNGNTKFELRNIDYAGSFSEGLAHIRKGDKIGFIDKTGKIIVKPQFDRVEDFQEGLAAVCKNAKWGFINKKGEIVINPQFDGIDERFPIGFSEGLVAVKSQNGQWGFINKKGKIIVKPQFDRVANFQEGLAAVCKNAKWGFINKKGEIVINLKFHDYEFIHLSFHNGLAAVPFCQDKQCEDVKWGFIDKKGNLVINPQFVGGQPPFFVDGIAFVMGLPEWKWGIIDKKGKYLVKPQFNGIGHDIYD
ncbi:MAG: WG repeat-containing protein, partial [Bacteroidales bacterium]|nr:WG repeat-containing protein [Bacteroidales bacterium]